MIRFAPTRTAPITTLSPTPPAPMTRTLAPGSTWAVFITAPIPVITEQPMSAATSKGTSGSIFTTPSTGSTVRSAKQETPRKW